MRKKDAPNQEADYLSVKSELACYKANQKPLSYYDEVLTRCLKARRGPDDFLLELLEQEVASRRVSALQNRITAAKFPNIKDLDTFKFEEASVCFPQQKNDSGIIGPAYTSL